MKLSIVVPCYNEAENIPLILKRFDDVIKREDIEVLLVDNGSHDGSAQIINRLLPKYAFAKTIHIEMNQGYGYGIVQGLKACNGEFIGWTHADMQTDPADLIKALNIIESKNNDRKLFVKGNRKGRSFLNRFFTKGMSIFETIYMGMKLHDINAQPNVFHRSFFTTWKNPPKDFSLDLYALYMAQKSGLHIVRFDVVFPERIYGESHWNTGAASILKFIKRTIEFSKKLKKEGIS